jgi:hypothetical protein
MLYYNHIYDHISFKARQEVGEQMGQDPQLMQLQQTDPQQFQIRFDAAVATAVAEITTQLVQEEMKASMAKQDPLVRIKQQEIDLRAMDMQRKAEETKYKQEQENQREAEKLNFQYDRLQQQDQQADNRLDIAERKLEQK